MLRQGDDHIDEDLDPVYIDTGELGGIFIAAHIVDVTAGIGLLGE